jgi:hypothetical protein
MGDRGTTGAPGGGEGGGFDREIDLRAVVGFGIGLALVMTLILILIGILIGMFRSQRAALDPRPSPMAMTRTLRLPPGPRLQSDPVQEMESMRQAEEETLHSYAWIDRESGIARIPIDRAIDILARTGLQDSPPAPSSREPAVGRRVTPKDRHRRQRP